MEFPAGRALTPDELAIAVADLVLNDRQNPGRDLPFQPSSGAFFARLGISPNSPVAQSVHRANPELEFRLAEYCWRLVGLGFMVPRLTGDYGAFHLTDRGRAFLESFDASTLTHGGLDATLATMGFLPDDPPRFYGRLGQECFLAGHYESSIVMLGVGTEWLVDAFATAAKGASVAPPGLSKLGPRPTAAQSLEWLTQNFTRKRREWRAAVGADSAEWVEALASLLDGAGQAIRLTRNEMGHPTGLSAGQGAALQVLMIYPTFAAACRNGLAALGTP